MFCKYLSLNLIRVCITDPYLYSLVYKGLEFSKLHLVLYTAFILLIQAASLEVLEFCL